MKIEERIFSMPKTEAEHIKNLNYTDFITEQYDNKLFELNEEMYNQTLSIYLENSNNCDIRTFEMLLWALLMDNKTLLTISETNKCNGDFYNENKIIIDFCIEKILRETKAVLGNLIYSKGWKHIPNNPEVIDMPNTLVWILFGNGISMTNWALAYSNDESITTDISEYCKNDSIKFVLKRTTKTHVKTD